VKIETFAAIYRHGGILIQKLRGGVGRGAYFPDVKLKMMLSTLFSG
jgi:hypothetical protein